MVLLYHSFMMSIKRGIGQHEVYLAAKQAHPERWNGRKTRDWMLEDIVFLNPDKKVLEGDYAALFEHTVESGA